MSALFIKNKGKGKTKNYYNSKAFKDASKRAYKNWPYKWPPQFRRDHLHTPSNLPTNLQLKIKYDVTKSAKIAMKILAKKMTTEREQTYGIFTPVKIYRILITFAVINYLLRRTF